MGLWFNASTNMLAWLVIGRLMVHASSVPFALTMLIIPLLTASHQLAPASAAQLVQQRPCHALCLCDNVCKRSPAACKSRALCPVVARSRLLPVRKSTTFSNKSLLLQIVTRLLRVTNFSNNDLTWTYVFKL